MVPSELPEDARPSHKTGIVACEAERLVLKPHRLRFRRAERRTIVVEWAAGMLLLGFLAVWVFEEVAWWQSVLAAAVVTVAVAWWLLVDTTLLALEEQQAVLLERRSVLTGLRWKRLLWRFADIEEVAAEWEPYRSRPAELPFVLFLNPQPARVVLVVTVKVGGKHELFWYTRHEEAGLLIGRTLARMAGAPFREPVEREP